MTDDLTVVASVTPNPETMKFTVNRRVADGRGETYSDLAQAFLSPLARLLFEQEGVGGVFLLKDFVTIRRTPGAEWAGVAPRVEAALRQFFAER